MQYTGGSLYQGGALESIVAGLTGATGVEGVILSNQADFNTKNTAVSVKNTSQDNALSSLETKATGLESGATGLEGRNTALDAALVVVQSREDALLAGLTGAAGLEERAVGFNTNITAINANLNGNIQEQINTKVADSIFQSLKTEFETDFAAFQTELNQKVVTATQEVLDARQDSDDAVLEKKFCSIEEFAQTFLQTYTVLKGDGSVYKFDGKIQNNDKAPPIFSIVEKAQSVSVPTSWDLKVKLTDYGYNVMSGNLIVKNGVGAVVNTLTKTDFDATTKLYTLTLANSNSAGTLINDPFTFEYRASTSTAVYSLTLDGAVLQSVPLAGSSGGNGGSSSSGTEFLGDAAWGRWIGSAGNESSFGISVSSDEVYVVGFSNENLISKSGLSTLVLSDMGTRPGVGTVNNDAFIIKYNSSGTAQWGRWIGGTGNDQVLGISASSDGVYVAGHTTGSLISVTGLSSAVITDMGTKPGDNDAFIIKYNTSGTAQWGRWIGGSVIDQGFGVAVSSDAVYITGRAASVFTPMVGLSSAVITDMGTNPGPYDAFIFKYNTSGEAQWARWIGGTSTDEQGNSISVSSDGIYMTGYTKSALLSTPGLSSAVITNMGTKPSTSLNTSAFIVKYNTSGEAQWARWIGGIGFAQGLGISATSDGVYMTGFTEQVLINTSGLSSAVITNMGTKPGTSNDAFIIKYSTSGDAQWARWIGSVGNDQGQSISATTDAVYVTGYSSSVLAVTEGLSNDVITGMGTRPSNSGSTDGFLIKYNLDGSALWARWVGGLGSLDRSKSVFAYTDGVYVMGQATGNFVQTAGISSNFLTDMGTRPGTGANQDAFIIKYV